MLKCVLANDKELICTEKCMQKRVYFLLPLLYRKPNYIKKIKLVIRCIFSLHGNSWGARITSIFTKGKTETN